MAEVAAMTTLSHSLSSVGSEEKTEDFHFLVGASYEYSLDAHTAGGGGGQRNDSSRRSSLSNVSTVSDLSGDQLTRKSQEFKAGNSNSKNFYGDLALGNPRSSYNSLERIAVSPADSKADPVQNSGKESEVTGQKSYYEHGYESSCIIDRLEKAGGILSAEEERRLYGNPPTSTADNSSAEPKPRLNYGFVPDRLLWNGQTDKTADMTWMDLMALDSTHKVLWDPDSEAIALANESLQLHNADSPKNKKKKSKKKGFFRKLKKILSRSSRSKSKVEKWKLDSMHQHSHQSEKSRSRNYHVSSAIPRCQRLAYLSYHTILTCIQHLHNIFN